MNDPIKILIVEDEIIVAMEIEFVLQSAGYKVIGKAPSSEKAIELSRSFLPDIILMDVNIKGVMDGINTAVEILKFYNPAIIFISANSDNETKNKMNIVEPHYFLPKPYSHSELKALIERVINTNKI